MDIFSEWWDGGCSEHLCRPVEKVVWQPCFTIRKADTAARFPITSKEQEEVAILL